MGSKLDHYATDTKAIDGEWITLEDTGLRVRVSLPTNYNRPYQRALSEYLAVELDSDGNVVNDMTRYDRFENMMRAFSEACILEIEGDNTFLPLDFDKYYRLIAELYERAQKQANAIEETGEDQVKKP